MNVAAFSRSRTSGQQRLARLASVARVVKKGEAECVGVREFPAEISGGSGVAELIAGPLTVGRKIACRARVVEFAQCSAELGFSVARPKGSSVSFQGQL